MMETIASVSCDECGGGKVTSSNRMLKIEQTHQAKSRSSPCDALSGMYKGTIQLYQPQKLSQAPSVKHNLYRQCQPCSKSGGGRSFWCPSLAGVILKRGASPGYRPGPSYSVINVMHVSIEAAVLAV